MEFRSGHYTRKTLCAAPPRHDSHPRSAPPTRFARTACTRCRHPCAVHDANLCVTVSAGRCLPGSSRGSVFAGISPNGLRLAGSMCHVVSMFDARACLLRDSMRTSWADTPVPREAGAGDFARIRRAVYYHKRFPAGHSVAEPAGLFPD